MLAKRIIPCLDVENGRVVKGVKFQSLIDAGDPVAVAKRYDEALADELTFLDITASSEERATLLHTIEKVANQVFIPLTVGGGVRSIADIRRLLSAGADKVSINTAAIVRPELIDEASATFGRQAIVVAVDALWDEHKNTWIVVSHGGRKKTDLEVIPWVKAMEEKGAGEILLTSMDRDGTKKGFELTLTRTVANSVNIPVIASGGVGSIQDLIDGIHQGKAEAVLAASIFHFNEISIRQAKLAMQEAGIEVRL